MRTFFNFIILSFWSWSAAGDFEGVDFGGGFFADDVAMRSFVCERAEEEGEAECEGCGCLRAAAFVLVGSTSCFVRVGARARARSRNAL